MYYVTCDGFPLLDWRDEDLILVSPRVKLEVNTVGEGSFTIYKNHPHYDKFKKLKSVFEISDESDVIFRGRATGDTIDFDHGKAVDLEGAMAFFNDSVVRPFHLPDDFRENADYITASESGNVIEFFLGWLIDNHNAQVEDFQKMKLGNVTVSDPNNYITRSNSDYSSTWATLKDKLFDSSLGGYLCIRYEADGNYIDYLEDFTEVNSQEIAFGENILDLKKATEATGTYSAIIPIGALGLTIEGVEDGDITEDLVKSGDTIYSKSAVAEYGWIYAPTSETTWDDVTEERNLLKKGGEWLLNGGMLLSHGVEVSAVDLHFTDAQIESMRIYKKVNVRSAPHNLTEQFSLTKLEIELLEPQNTKIAIGKTIVPLSERTIKQEDEVRKKYSKLSKNDEEILMEVQDFGRELGQTLRISADGVTVTNAAGETLTIDGGQIDATKIKAQDLDASQIKAGDLVLTGTLSWSDFTDKEQASTMTIDANGLVCTADGKSVTISGGQIDASSINTEQLDASKINAGDLKLSGVLSWADFSSDAQDELLEETTQAAKDDITQTVIPDLDDRILASQERADSAYDLAWDAESIANEAMEVAEETSDEFASVKKTSGGRTYIDGSKIYSNSIYADSMHLGGSLTIYAGEKSTTIGGYLGYTTSANDGSAGMHMQKGNGEVVVTNNGAKLTYGGSTSQISVHSGGIGMTSNGTSYVVGQSSFYNTEDCDLGTSLNPWGQIYANNSTISTSDRNKKNTIDDLDDRYLVLFDHLRPVRFKFNDGTSGRFHPGFISQDVEEALDLSGIDSQEFGGFVKDVDHDTGEELYFLRYEEFIPILAAKIKQLEEKIQTLEDNA